MVQKRLLLTEFLPIGILAKFFSPQTVGGKAGSGGAGSKCWNPLAWQAQLEGAILSGAAGWCDIFNGGVHEGEGGLHSAMLLVGVQH